MINFVCFAHFVVSNLFFLLRNTRNARKKLAVKIMNERIENLEDGSILIHFDLGELGTANAELGTKELEMLYCPDSEFRVPTSALCFYVKIFSLGALCVLAV